MKSLIALIPILGLIGLAAGVVAKAAETATVSSTVTPRKISVAITTDGSVAYGIVSLNTTKDTLSPADTQTAKNDGNDTENLNIKSSDATGGATWELAASVGSDQFVHKFSKDSGSNWIQFPVDNNYTSLATGVAVNGTQSFDLQITTPNATTDYVQKTITVTVQATEYQAAGQYPIRGTYLNFYRDMPQEFWAQEFDQMKQVDVDTVVIVSVGRLKPDGSGGYTLSEEGLLYPSSYVTLPPSFVDRLEMILSLADQRGMHVYVGSLQTHNSWYTGEEFPALRNWNKLVAQEIVQHYGSHSSLKGWYFTQEIWMNWVKYYGAAAYYGTQLLADFRADMDEVNPTKLITTSTVFKKYGEGEMPGLTPQELDTVMGEFLGVVQIDMIMPQDGIGAGAGAPSLSEIGSYFQAARAAADRTNTILWSTVETFTAQAGVPQERYPVAPVTRIAQQISNERPYVSGFIEWIFGDNMSYRATYYPVEASQLFREYRSYYDPSVPTLGPWPMTYSLFPPPSSQYPDIPSAPKLSNRTGGGYDGNAMTDWVGFPNDGTVTVLIDLGEKRKIKEVRALSRSQQESWIIYPQQMNVKVSNNGTSFSLFGTFTSYPANTQNYSITWGSVTGSAQARYVQIEFPHIAWLFLSEVEVLGPFSIW